MREFKSLFPRGLSEDFDALIHGEEPIVSVDESNRRITISYTFPGFYLSGDSEIVDGAEIQFQQVNIEGTGKSVQTANPSYPRSVDTCRFLSAVITSFRSTKMPRWNMMIYWLNPPNRN